jgi:hypothetical protein
MSKADDFRAFAAECRELAFQENVNNQVTDSTRRAKLLRMADAWQSLAADEDRIAALVHEADCSFEVSGADAPPTTPPLWATQGTARRAFHRH